MPRYRKQWSTSTERELYDKLKDLSKLTRIPTSKLLDEAIENLLERHNYEYLKQQSLMSKSNFD